MGRASPAWFTAVIASIFVAACVSPDQWGDRDASAVQAVDDASAGDAEDPADGPATSPTDAAPWSPPDAADATFDGPPDLRRGPTCGNGVIEAGEECDPPGTCPTSCPARGCSRFVLQGSAAACTARCVDAPAQTACVAADGCCPAGCNAGTDSDCSIVCGNGAKEGSETCDPLTTCPASCPANGCQRRRLINAGTCTAECVNDGTQTACQNADGCCPGGCDNNNDSDCTPRCGNGVVETGESCELPACSAMAADCTSDANFVRTPSGDPSKCTFRCTTTNRACNSGDGFCPSGCSFPGDADCKRATGQACSGSNSECLSGFCASGFCCDQACAGGCHSCAGTETGGANGTCLPVRAGADPKNNCTTQPTSSCQNDGSCDGAGHCRLYSASTTCSPSSCAPDGTEQPAGLCSGSGVCNVPPPITCSRTCGAESCGGSSCALSSPFYCMPEDTPSSITQCEARISGRPCDGDPTDEFCDKSSTYLYRYKKVGANRYDLVSDPYFICDWNDDTPTGERMWHTGS